MKTSVLAIAVVVGVIGVLIRLSHLLGVEVPHHRLIGYGMIAVAVILFIYALIAKKPDEAPKRPA